MGGEAWERVNINVESSTNGVTVARLEGALAGPNAQHLEAELRPIVSVNAARVVVDLANVNRVDSAGLGALVTLTCQSNLNQGRLVFARPTLFVAEVLTTTRLDTFLSLAPSMEEAMAKASGA
jgi:anti-anti-sigma factor